MDEHRNTHNTRPCRSVSEARRALRDTRGLWEYGSLLENVQSKGTARLERFVRPSHFRGLRAECRTPSANPRNGQPALHTLV